jgi:hypothetical protein
MAIGSWGGKDDVHGDAVRSIVVDTRARRSESGAAYPGAWDLGYLTSRLGILLYEYN